MHAWQEAIGILPPRKNLVMFKIYCVVFCVVHASGSTALSDVSGIGMCSVSRNNPMIEHACLADIMEHVIQRNAALGYTEPTTAQLAAAAKVSIQEMRGALATAKSLSQVWPIAT
jgi:hypothetical protein